MPAQAINKTHLIRVSITFPFPTNKPYILPYSFRAVQYQ